MLLVSILLIGITAYLINWNIHRIMCKGEHLPYGYATFKQFTKEFNKCKGKLKHEEYFNKSIFIEVINEKNSLVNECYIHAGIIKFNDKCMIIKPHEHWKFLLWKYQFLKSINQKEKVDWSI